jgi:hypothetical protein
MQYRLVLPSNNVETGVVAPGLRLLVGPARACHHRNLGKCLHGHISIKCQMDCGDVGSLISIGGVILRRVDSRGLILWEEESEVALRRGLCRLIW